MNKTDLLSKLCKVLILANKSENVCKILTSLGLVFSDCIKNEFVEEACEAIKILDVVEGCVIPCENKFGRETLIEDFDEEGKNNGESISNDGNFLVIGDDSANKVYIYEKIDDIWTYKETLTSASNNQFGSSVYIKGEYLIVGSPIEKSAYIYKYNNINWILDEKITSASINFGNSVAIDGMNAIIGSDGIAYFYEKINNSWSLSGSVDGGIGSIGENVSLCGEYAIVSDTSNSSAKIYRKTNAGWIIDTDTIINGIVVSISDKYAIVGNDGNVYLYDKSDAGWVLRQTISSSIESFGLTVSISGEHFIVGAQNDSSAYIYERNGSSWELFKTINPPDSDVNLGTSVTISCDVAAVSGRFGNPPNTTYVYDC
jgi:hypothetical protein